MDRLTFFRRLRESRLLNEAQLADVAARYPSGVPAHAVAAALINDGTLTRFQAQRLWAGQLKGLVLGRYRVLDEVGKGGFGRVYKAVHTLMGRVVALKVIAPELVEDRRARDWFKREVRAVTQLCHPNVVMAYDADEVDDVLFLAMEFVDGPSLEALVRQQGPVPAGPAAAMMRQAALALQYAHEQGMVHRDVKPANLLVARSGGAGTPSVVKVVDFGLARLHGTGARAHTLMLGGDKGFVGTPDFVSPEQARDVHAADIRSDLYSLGCTFYFALSGHRPFAGTSVLETVVKHMQEEPRPLGAVRAEVPPELTAVIRRLMAKDPAARFQTPAELAEALAPLCPAADEAPRPTPARAAVAAAAVPGGADNLPATALVPDLAFWSAPQGRDGEEPSSVTPSPLGAEVRTDEVPSAPLPAPAPAAPPAREAERVEICDVRPVEAPPAPAGPPQIGAPLRGAWSRWLALVEMIAGHGRPEEVSAADYRELHGRLLAACRDELGRAPAPGQDVLRRLETLVEPWLSPHALASMDPEALASLLLRCRQMDRDLGLARGGAGLWRWAVLFLALFAGVGLAGWLCRQQGWVLQVRSWAASLWPLVQTHPVVATAVLLPVVVLAALCLLPRLFRSW